MAGIVVVVVGGNVVVVATVSFEEDAVASVQAATSSSPTRSAPVRHLGRDERIMIPNASGTGEPFPIGDPRRWRQVSTLAEHQRGQPVKLGVTGPESGVGSIAVNEACVTLLGNPSVRLMVAAFAVLQSMIGIAAATDAGPTGSEPTMAGTVNPEAVVVPVSGEPENAAPDGFSEDEVMVISPSGQVDERIGTSMVPPKVVVMVAAPVTGSITPVASPI